MSDAPLMLSISGARGIVGKTMTPEIVARYTGAFGSLLRESVTDRPPRLVVGFDGRRSGSCLASAAAAGLAAVGCEVTLIGIATTPTVGVMIKELGCDGGINVTASHNPIEWNGTEGIRINRKEATRTGSNRIEWNRIQPNLPAEPNLIVPNRTEPD